MTDAAGKQPEMPWEAKFNADFNRVCAAFWRRIATRAEQTQPTTTPAPQLQSAALPTNSLTASAQPASQARVPFKASGQRRMVHRRRKSTTGWQRLATRKGKSPSDRKVHSKEAQWIHSQVRDMPRPDGLASQRHCNIPPCGVAGNTC
ncbi:Hypothetical predicted protein [Pelobates cultripes]|uniref:Uncharacterized protein n=1 Tax=Pelobates cultripes TaxID=61616 RepID=A0AAD1S8X6_PELCU|nr:Hypothetical predicted protein [Pelobates cultripes]